MIEIKDLKKTFDKHSKNKVDVLKGINITLPDSGLIAIFGKSGSGKTTLLNILGGLEKPSSGTILYDGKSIKGNEDKLRNEKIGYIFQNYYLEKNATILDIMHNQMIIAGYKNEELIEQRTKEVLELVDMYRFKNKRSDALSGGQKQRVAIARALIKGSDYIFADEPTGNLDNENTIQVMEILKEISKTKLVVLVTHEQNLIRDYADSYIPIVDGLVDYNLKVSSDVKYDIDKNNIYVDKNDEKSFDSENIEIKLYGKSEKKAKLEIYNDNDKVYLVPKENIVILNSNSEKKITYEKEIKIKREVPNFKNTSNKKRGRLFSLRSVTKDVLTKNDEKIYSLSFIIKCIFLLGLACIICFLSLSIFDHINDKKTNKKIDDAYYVNLSSYPEIRKISEDKYENVDFFETQYRLETFSFDGSFNLPSINTECEIRTFDNNKLIYGNVPREKEVVISSSLAKEIKKDLRNSDFNNDNTILSMYFKSDYKICGIVDNDSLVVYMNKVDYVNFLGVYSRLQLSDYNNYLLKTDFENIYLNSIISVNDELNLKDDECNIIIGRNSLYKIMKNSGEADYLIDVVNNKIKNENKAIQLRNSKLFVKSFSVSRDVFSTDIIVMINSNVMNNIFININPQIDNLKNDLSNNNTSSYYFKVMFNDDQKNALDLEFKNRGIQNIDINNIYNMNKSKEQNDVKREFLLYIMAIILLYIVFYLIEKSASLKNSKEYGIYRAIGVNKSNLLFKEFITSIINNVVCYTMFFILIITLMSVRYEILNLSVISFIGLAISLYILSVTLMLLISLIPYLFVLFNMPAKILARYDI